MEKSINQRRGPTVGNAGAGSKRADFTADKKSKQSLSADIVAAIAGRASQPEPPTTNRQKNQGAAVGLVNRGRGPTRGNK